MNSKSKLFETDRLILRRHEFADAEDMFNNYCNNDNVTKYMSWGTHKTLDDTKAYLQYVALPKYEQDNTYLWSVVLKKTKEVIGCIEVLKVDLERKSAMFGWVLGEKYWGQGLMPEAACVIRDYLFDEGFVGLWAMHHVNNPKSGRVMQKIGMIHEGTLHKSELDNQGNLVDVELYAITK